MTPTPGLDRKPGTEADGVKSQPIIRHLLAALLLALTLTGCVGISSQVPNWPEMTVKVHVIPEGEIHTRCAVLIPPWAKLLGAVTLACAYFNFDENICEVYVSPTTTIRTYQHELEHCRGGDHNGILRSAYERWKAYRKTRGEE